MKWRRTAVRYMGDPVTTPVLSGTAHLHAQTSRTHFSYRSAQSVIKYFAHPRRAESLSVLGALTHLHQEAGVTVQHGRHCGRLGGDCDKEIQAANVLV